MDIGEKIKEARKKKRYTQQQLADVLGVQHSAIHKYEKGLVSPSIETVVKIANALDIKPSLLLGEEELHKNVCEMAIDKLSKLSNENQTTVCGIIGYLYRTNDPGVGTLTFDFTKLNFLGKRKALEYLEDLTEIEKYTTPDE